MASFLYPALAALLGNQQQPSGPTARDALGLSPSQGPLPLQQMLAQPGPSRPTWMAPVMEHQQLLATSMDPGITGPQRQAANEAFNRQMFGVAMATGPGITKEQKAAWEAENAAYRAGRAPSGVDPRVGAYSPGTRVYIRPGESFERYSDPFHKGRENFNGVVVDPSKVLLADKMGWDPLRAEKQSMTPPSPDHVAVQFEGPHLRDAREGGTGGWWFWRHRNELEVLPPLEKFKEGDAVEFRWSENEEPEFYGTVTKPPKGHAPSPGPDYVWVDVPRGLRPAKAYQGPKAYEGEAWGAWFNIKDLFRSKK